MFKFSFYHIIGRLMPSSGVESLDGILGGEGYPGTSAILVTGPAGIGKESLGYWFMQAGLEGPEPCLYVTRLSTRDVQQDQKAFGISSSKRSPIWLARSGGQVDLDINNLQDLTHKINAQLTAGKDAGIRMVMDALSSILVLNPAETAYKFVGGLIESVKQNGGVLLATIEDGMHSPQTIAAMQQLFDGVIEFSFDKTGLRIVPMLRVVKMRGITPRHEYYAFSFSRSGMHLGPAGTETGPERGSNSAALNLPATIEPLSVSSSLGGESKSVFDYLAKSFIEDYMQNKQSIEQSGWRTRIAISKATGVNAEILYGKEGKFGPVMKELISSGLVETRFFSGQRGRGGEVTKMRVAYEKESVKRIVDDALRKGAS